jgi:uncharacterized damage-inducible protein DinB
MFRMLRVSFLLPFVALPLAAQSAENPISSIVKAQYQAVKTVVIRSAEKVPESDYSFKPVDSVRTFGQLLGHIANTQYSYCSTVLGEKNPNQGVDIEKKTTKAEIEQALKESFAYCDKAYDGMTDAKAIETTKFYGREAPKIGVLTQNNGQDAEHYGNLVTYMRIRNIVPPSSERRR